MSSANQRLQIVYEYERAFDNAFRRLMEYAPEPDQDIRFAHYTSVEVAENIIKRNEIWMSHPFHMNDIEELQFGIELGTRLLPEYCRNTEPSSEVWDKTNKKFQDMIKNMNDKTIIDTYVLCFTAHKPEDKEGSLPMWRSYGDEGHGAAIVFDPSKFPKGPSFPLRMAKIVYKTASEREQILAEILGDWQQITKEYFVKISNRKIEEEDLDTAAFYAFILIKIFALMTKHEGFCYENEWRIIYLPELDPYQYFECFKSYHIGTHGIEPKLKLNINRYNGLINEGTLNFERVNFNESVEKIILGPSISSRLARDTFLRVLTGTDFEGLREKVYASTIPLRPSK